jgi:hypothetical protein
MIVMVLAVLAFSALSCEQVARKDQDLKIAPAVKTAKIEALAKKRRAFEKELIYMNISSLAEELRKDSNRGMEPFNSMAYKELVSRKEAAPVFKNYLRDANRSSLLGLLALSKADPREYRKLTPSFRVNVLVDALEKSKYFNTWGLPHAYWEEAAKVLISEGKAAQMPLKRLLDDRRRAPMWGSEEVMESKMYAYRVCDYAWAIIMATQGRKIEIPIDPKERDKLISQLKAKL